MAARYALYAAPPAGSPLAELGADLLGYDAASGTARPQAVPSGFDPGEWHTLTEDPRRYGFHGTLKAPFRLAPGCDVEALARAAAAFAASEAPVCVPLQLACLGSFLALVPRKTVPALHALADSVVRDFEPFRAPLSPAERERRLRSPLTPRQIELLEGFGYPYVFEQFRFHMTLTGRLPPERIDAAEAALTDMVADAVAEPFALDALVMFEQRSPEDRFFVRARFPFGG
jgi:putative phosphonate metabolism protein